MNIKVLCFGILQDLTGSGRDTVQLPLESTVGDLMQLLRARGIIEEKVWSSIAVAVNREYAGLRTHLQDGDEVALLPPVSGGSHAR